MHGVADFDELKPAYIVGYGGDSYNTVTFNNNRSALINGIPSSVIFIMSNNNAGLNHILSTINNAGNGEKIITVFSIPRLAVKDRLSEFDEQTLLYVTSILYLDYNQTVVTKTLNARPSTIDGYTPRNKKLLQFPFVYLAFNPSNRITKYI